MNTTSNEHVSFDEPPHSLNATIRSQECGECGEAFLTIGLDGFTSLCPDCRRDALRPPTGYPTSPLMEFGPQSIDTWGTKR